MSRWIVSTKIRDDTLTEVIFVFDNLDSYEIQAEVFTRLARLRLPKEDWIETKYREFDDAGTLQGNGPEP